MACVGFLDACGASKVSTVDGFGGQRLVQGGDGETGVLAGGAPAPGLATGGVERINDRFQDAAAVIAPSCAVKGHRELAVAGGVDRGNTVHQLRYLRAGAQPILGGVLDGSADPVAAVT
ncbi:hypothetical protein A5689_21275 [Mycobacterium intracellulare subsp. yongonense]|nr:hypothetical protein A5689_21275 [Mycobacterium intracellulare subsp. yongonense]